jgi:myo-inositol-1(or 4)-monophosphatase
VTERSATPSTDLPQDSLGQIALTAAWAGREAIARALTTGDLATSSKSAAHDLVTDADKAAEAAVLQVIRHLRPDDAILGEETGEHPGTTRVRWVVDPLDGTVNFVYGRQGWSVSVGAEVDGEPVAGALVCPADGRWVVADAGLVHHGGFSSPVGRPHLPTAHALAANEAVDLADALVTIGYPYGLAKRQWTTRAMEQLIGKTRGLRVTGAAATDLLDVALGQVDAFVGVDLPPWDTTAGAAIASACGAAVQWATSTNGMSLIIAARTPQLASTLRDWLVNLQTNSAEAGRWVLGSTSEV